MDLHSPIAPRAEVRVPKFPVRETIPSWHNPRTVLSMNPPATNGASPLLRDTRGAVMSEYVVLVGTVSLTVAVAVAALGPPLVRGFEDTRDILLLPFP